MDTLSVLARYSEEIQGRSDNEVSTIDRSLNLLFNSEVVMNAIKHYIETQEDHFLTDTSGHHFHKSFREWKVIDDTHLAGSVWLLIGKADLFWYTIKKMKQEESENNLVVIHITDKEGA